MDLRETYRRHPFWVLDATPRHTREELVELQSTAALFGDDESAAAALAALLNPQERLRAELSWFPRTDARVVKGLLNAVLQGRPAFGMPFSTESFLAQFNAARLALATVPLVDVPTFMEVLLTLAELADTLLPQQVRDEINEDRARSGFPLLDDSDEMGLLIEGLLHETVGAYRNLRPAQLEGAVARELSAQLQERVRRRGTPEHNSLFLEYAAEEIATW